MLLGCSGIPSTVGILEPSLLSYSMTVLYSRDHKGVGVAHEITSPKNQPQFSQTMMRQYWLGKTKPKQAFKSTQNTFKKLLWNFFLNYLMEFSTD